MTEFNPVDNPIVERENFKIINKKIVDRINKDLKESQPFHYLFTGVTGSGKTHLGTAVVIKCKEDWELVSAMQHYQDHIRIIGSDYIDKMDADRKNDNKFSDTPLLR